MSAPVLPVDKFQSRDELVSFIEQQATTAVEKATRVERRVPWVTSGPVCADSAGYSVLKAAAYALGFVGPDQAKEEIHAHQQLRDLYAGYGFSPHHGQQSFLVPLASAHLPAFEPQGRKLRDELHQKLTANADRYDPDEADWIGRRLNPYRKALGTVTDTAGGTMVPLPMLGELIDLQRSLEVFATAGAREVALPPNGRIQFPKLTAASTAYWVGEGSAITESQPTTGNLDLQAKKLGVFVKLNNELLRFASPSAEGLVRLDMARAAALKADLAMLEGTGGTQIKGLITYSGISTHTASTTGTDGNTFTPADVALMESKLPDAVEAPTAWVMRKAMFAALMNRRSDSVSANDGKGPFLFRDMRYASSGPPAELYGTRVVRSAQVSATRVKGSGTNLTYMLLGYFPDWRVSKEVNRPKRRRAIDLRLLHRVHGIHRRARFPPDSVHHSVHRFLSSQEASGHLGRPVRVARRAGVNSGVADRANSLQPHTISPDDLDRLSALLAPARDLAVALTPPLPRLPEEQVVRTTAKAGPKDRQVERALDAAAMTSILAEADKVLGAVHDVAIAVFQKMVDQLAGQACPLADQNLSVAKMVNERAERFGLGLYFRYHDQFHRVTLDMKPIGERYWKGSSPEAIAAGRITPRTIKGPGEPVGHEALPTGKRLAEAATFPELIVARTAEQAEAIWQARQTAASNALPPT